MYWDSWKERQTFELLLHRAWRGIIGGYLIYKYVKSPEMEKNTLTSEQEATQSPSMLKLK